MEDDPGHPLFAQLLKLKAHLFRVQLAIEEPEGQNAVLARRFTEALDCRRQVGPGHTRHSVRAPKEMVQKELRAWRHDDGCFGESLWLGVRRLERLPDLIEREAMGNYVG